MSYRLFPPFFTTINNFSVLQNNVKINKINHQNKNAKLPSYALDCSVMSQSLIIIMLEYIFK